MTRCRVCLGAISKGDLIARPESGYLVPVLHETKSKWSHPKCLAKVMVAGDEARKEAARFAYEMRMRRRERRDAQSA